MRVDRSSRVKVKGRACASRVKGACVSRHSVKGAWVRVVGFCVRVMLKVRALSDASL